MAARFAGFPAETLEFFRELEANNNREWFGANRHVYDACIRPAAMELVCAINAELAKFAPAYISEPKDAIYRIHRDTRFSPNKTPYKTHVGMLFKRQGMARHVGGGLYCAVSNKEVEIAGGVYMPGAEELRAFRTCLAERYEEFRAITGDRKVRKLCGEIQGERLRRAPKGFAPDHPAADLLKHKQWYFDICLEPELALSPRVLTEIVSRFRVMTPLVKFFDAALLGRGRKAGRLLL